MSKKILITGGAGFIGAHVGAELLNHGYRVRALDTLDPQVHELRRPPAYLHPDIELVVGDLTDREVVRGSLRGVEAVIHLAARVGVGQSMYEAASYTWVNSYGTAVLLETLMDKPVEKVVIASSMSVYGEGLYADASETYRENVKRKNGSLSQGHWEPTDDWGKSLRPLPTPEWKRPDLASVYALGKYDQERLVLMFGESYSVPVVALRLFNVYGPHQALSNPYTGVLAIFSNRLAGGLSPLVFEDGKQQRDFVHVTDVARAFRLALETERAAGKVINIGSGSSVTIGALAAMVARAMGREIVPTITGRYRAGDIRHCYADITAAKETLGFEPQVPLEAGLHELASWAEKNARTDSGDKAMAELASRGLLR